MGSIMELQNIVETMGLRGQEALQFIREQQELARTLRQEEREEAEKQREEAERQRQHELTLQQAAPGTGQAQNGNERKTPKLPKFIDGTDAIDSYLQRFERLARTNNWTEDTWAVSLSLLLTGKALDVYSRLSDEEAVSYMHLKQALLKRYNLTEEGYRNKFRICKPEKDETPEQFVFRMKTYLDKWVEFSPSDASYAGLRNLIVKEQVLDALQICMNVILRTFKNYLNWPHNT